MMKMNSYEEAAKEAESKRDYIDRLMPVLLRDTYEEGLNNNAAMIGRSFIDHVIGLCEAVLTAVCWDYVSEDGKYPFPRLEDLFPKKIDCLVPFSPETCIAAGALTSIKKENRSNKMEPNADLIEQLLVAAKDFVNGIGSVVKGDHSEIKCIADWMEGVYKDYTNRYRSYKEYNVHHQIAKSREAKFGGTSNGFGMLYMPKGMEEDDLTDEQLDEFYRIRNKNSSKHIAILEIFELIKNAGTSIDNRIGVNDVVKLLEKKCGIKMERKAVARNLTQLQEADFLCQVQGEKGYWYDSELVKHRNGEYDF